MPRKQNKIVTLQKKTSKTKIRQVGTDRQLFLPASVTIFIKNGLLRIFAIFLLAGSIGLVIALYYYNPADPAPNNVTEVPVTNPLGPIGASFADILTQTLGFAAYFLVFPFIIWAVKLMRLCWLPYFWLNLSFLPVGVVLIALAMSVYPPHPDYVIQAGYGGALGHVIYGYVVSLTANFVISSWIYVLGFTVLALPAYSFSLAMTRTEWRRTGGILLIFLQVVIKAAVWLVRMIFTAFKGGVSRSTAHHVRKEPAIGRASAKKAHAKAFRSTEDQSLDSPDLKSAVRPRKKPRRGVREEKERQANLPILMDDSYLLPPLDLLAPAPFRTAADAISADALAQNAAMLLSVLEDFGISGDIKDVRPGPVVTLYELEPARGTKSSRVIGLADDIARSMSAVSARVAVVPGRNAIGIELPNLRRETVFLRELLASKDYENTRARLGIVLGKDISGAPVVVDLAGMPHLLVAGTTGSGKSVGINTMILSLLYKHSPETLKLIMVDPKMLELSIYDDIPHLLTPVVTEAKKAVVALKWAVREMEERYAKMSKLKVRNLAAFNKRVLDAMEKGETLTRIHQPGYDKETGEPIIEEEVLDYDPLPFIVIVIDEMADLMVVAGKEVEATVQRLAQMARAAGLHVIMATQRPSVDVITGTIKANFPTRVSFQVTSKIDSRTILNEQGAEQLLGMGDMLYMAGGGRVTRVHGAFVDDKEVEHIVEHLRCQGKPDYLSAVTEEPEGGFDSPFIPGSGGTDDGGEKSLYDKAVDIVLRDRRASTSYIQRRLSIGYNKAATLIEEMEEQGVISAPNHKGQREILVPEREEEFER